MRICRPFKIAPAIAVIAVIAAGCQPEAEQPSVTNDSTNEVLPLPKLPIAEPPMDRAALLQAVAKAASAAALGQDSAAAPRGLDGKRVEVRIRFGCAPTVQAKAGAGAKPTPKKGPFNVRFNSEDRTLRIRAAPDLTLDDPEVASLAGETVEAVEGFWMYRPWLLTAACPARPQEPQPAGEAGDASEPAASEPAAARPSGRRVGLAEFYTHTDARTARRDGRAYEATKVLAEGQLPSPQGYDLVLSGRLRPAPGGRVITCRVESVDSPPDCIVSAQFDRVRIERPDTKDIVAEWSS